MIAGDPTGTDWAAVAAMTSVVALLVSIATAAVTLGFEQRRRKQDARERVRFRRVDRQERKDLLDLELELKRRERLAENYGAWLQGLVAMVKHQVDAFFTRRHIQDLGAQGEKHVSEIASRFSPNHPLIHESRAQVARKQVEASDELSSAVGTLVDWAAQVEATVVMIMIDDAPAWCRRVSEVTNAIGQWDGSRREDGQGLLKRAGLLVEERIVALRQAKLPVPKKDAVADERP